MKRLVMAFLLVVFVASASVGSASAKSTALDGRLGGHQATFEKRLGKNNGLDETIKGLGYVSKGYGLIVVNYSSDIAVKITLAPDRASHVEANEVDPADWSSDQYKHVLSKFLPTDGKIVGLVRETGDGRQEGACHSDELSKAISKTPWKKLHASGNPGDCHFLLSPDVNGNIYQVELDLGKSGSLNNAVVQAPQATTESAPVNAEPTPTPQTVGFSTEEQAYLNQVSAISSQVGDAINDMADRFQSADIGSDTWTIHVAADFVAIRDGYQQALALVPPPVFETENALFVQGLAYASDATYNFETGITNLDSASIAQGGVALNQSTDLINQASAELDRIRNERGG